MRFRIFTEPQQGASYADQLRVAKAAENLGFDAFFRSDHYLAMGDTTGLPGPTDAFVTLGALARETTRIRLGTLVSPVTFRAPGPLAITVAQIDDMSGGRIELGLGAGWFGSEHTAYGIPFPPLADRFDMLAEQLSVIEGLWRTPDGQRFEFVGTTYQLSDSPALPKPVQFPRPPIILGGSGKARGAALAARYADEYNVGFRPVEQTRGVHDRIRAAVADYGREADTMTYSAALPIAAGANDAQAAERARAIGRDLSDLRTDGLAGTAGEIVDKIGDYSRIGVDTMYLQVLDLRDIAHLEFIAAQIAPQFPD